MKGFRRLGSELQVALQSDLSVKLGFGWKPIEKFVVPDSLTVSRGGTLISWGRELTHVEQFSDPEIVRFSGSTCVMLFSTLSCRLGCVVTLTFFIVIQSEDSQPCLTLRDSIETEPVCLDAVVPDVETVNVWFLNVICADDVSRRAV